MGQPETPRQNPKAQPGSLQSLVRDTLCILKNLRSNLSGLAVRPARPRGGAANRNSPRSSAVSAPSALKDQTQRRRERKDSLRTNKELSRSMPTTAGSYTEMPFRPISETCKSFIIHQTAPQYTTAGSFIEGPNLRATRPRASAAPSPDESHRHRRAPRGTPPPRSARKPGVLFSENAASGPSRVQARGQRDSTDWMLIFTNPR